MKKIIAALEDKKLSKLAEKVRKVSEKQLIKTASGQFVMKQDGEVIGYTLGKPYLMKAAVFLNKKDAKSFMVLQKLKKPKNGNYKFTMKQNGSKVVDVTTDTIRDASVYVLRLKVAGKEDPVNVVVKDDKKKIADVTLENFKAVAQYLDMLSLQMKWDKKGE